MNFTITDEQEMLNKEVERLLRDRYPTETVREIETIQERYSTDLWAALCSMGLPGIAVEGAAGGADASLDTVAVGAQLLGRHLAWTPMAATVAAARLLACTGRVELAKELVAGTATTAVAVVRETAAQSSATGISAALIVPFAPEAESAVVLTTNDRALLVDLNDRGSSVEAVDAIDRGPLGRLQLQEAAFEELGSPDDSRWSRHTHDALMAAEAAGGARGALDLAITYAKERHQFGRPIGSFQVLQHRLADLATRCDAAEMMTVEACWAVDNVSDADPIVMDALTYAVDVFADTARQAVQIGGGYGYMEEYDMQLYYRRAKMLQVLVRTPWLRGRGDALLADYSLV